MRRPRRRRRRHPSQRSARARTSRGCLAGSRRGSAKRWRRATTSTLRPSSPRTSSGSTDRGARPASGSTSRRRATGSRSTSRPSRPTRSPRSSVRPSGPRSPPSPTGRPCSRRPARRSGARPGAMLGFAGGHQLRVADVLPDALVGAAEVLVSRDVGRRIGVVHERYALVRPVDPSAARADVKAMIRPLLPPTLGIDRKVQVRAPGDTPYFRAGDAVLPLAAIKAAFGEFSARPTPNVPGGLEVEPNWLHANIVRARLPAIGRISACHRAVVPQLRRALRELVDRGLEDLGGATTGASCLGTSAATARTCSSHLGHRHRCEPDGELAAGRRPANPRRCPRARTMGLHVGRPLARPRWEPLRVPPVPVRARDDVSGRSAPSRAARRP